MLTNDEGYVLLALFQEKYLNLAISCAQSLKHFDSKRCRQIIVSENLEDKAWDSRIFDYVDVLQEDDQFPATLSKMRLHEKTRFKSNLFVDADCLLLKSSMDAHWKALSSHEFTIPGRAVTGGIWYETDLSEICRSCDIPYIVRMNSGVIFYKNIDSAKYVFERSKEMYVLHSSKIRQTHSGGIHGDEPFIGMAMGLTGQKPYKEIDNERGSLMFSTIGGSDFKLSIEEQSSLFLKGDVSVAPHILHFVGLRPTEEYNALREQFRLIGR